MPKTFWYHPQQGLGDPIPNPPEDVTVDKWLPAEMRIPMWRKPQFQAHVTLPIEEFNPPAPATVTIDQWHPSETRIPMWKRAPFYAPTTLPPATFAAPMVVPSIESTLALGTPTFLVAGATYSVFIDGTARNDYIKLETLNITQQLGSRGSCSFTTLDTAGSYLPSEGEEVVIYADTTRLFGGIITSVNSTFENATTVLYGDVTASDYGVLLDRHVARKHFDGITIIYQTITMIHDLLTEFCSDTPIRVGNGASGSTITGARTFNYITMTEAINQILAEVNLDFVVDPYAVLHLVDRTAGYANAPLSLTNTSANFRNPRKLVDGNKYANRVFVRSNVGQLNLQTDTFAGDDDFGAGFYLTTYILTEKPIVKVNDVEQTVVLWDAYSLAPHDFSYGENSWGVSRSPYSAALTSSDTVEVIYPGPLQRVAMAEDTALIATDGAREVIIEVKDVADPDVLQDIADGELLRRKVKPVTLTFDTRTDGVLPGHLLSATLTAAPHPSVSGSLVVDSVSSRIVQNMFWWHSVKATTQQVQGGGNWDRFAQQLILAKRQAEDRITYKVIIKLAKTVEGITNPGLVAGVLKDQRIAEKDGYFRDVVFRWNTPPTTTDVTVDIYKNGTSIFGSTKLTYRTTDSGTVTRFAFSSDPLAVSKGDVLTVEVLTADSAAKDGTIELTIQG